MNQASNFQLQNPLSSRKFWKKFLPNVFTYFYISLIIGGLIGFFLFLIIRGAGQSGDSGSVLFASIFLGVLVLYIITLLLNAWYIQAYINRYYYDCNEQFVTIKKGVFTPSEIHVQYQKIQDVYVDQDITDRILGLYDVHIASATVTSGIEAHIDGVDANTAENIKNYLLAKIKGENPSINQNGSQSQVPSPVSQISSSFQSTQKISTNTYPISGSWIFVASVGAFWYSFFGTLSLGLISLGIIRQIGTGLLCAGILFIVIFVIRIIWMMIWKSNYYFELMPDYILLRTGVISRSENHLPYKSIQNIINKQSLTERICGLATVVVQNAAQTAVQIGNRTSSVGVNISMIGQPKDKAEELNQILNDIISKISSQNSSVSMGL